MSREDKVGGIGKELMTSCGDENSFCLLFDPCVDSLIKIKRRVARVRIKRDKGGCASGGQHGRTRGQGRQA